MCCVLTPAAWRAHYRALCCRRHQLAELQREVAPLRASSADAAAALQKAQDEGSRLAARIATLETELDAKRREVEQLSAMCAELMGSVESKLGATATAA